MTAGSAPLYGGVPVVPQISQRLMPSIGTAFIADKIQWVQIMGTIVGNGEEWITIGNFDNTSTLQFIQVVYLLDLQIPSILLFR